MLEEVREQYGKVYEDHFNHVFEERFDVKCEWGFPILALLISSKSAEVKSHWRIAIDVTNEDFTLSSKAYRLESSRLEFEDGLPVPEWTSIDKTTLNLIVERVVLISQQIFGDDKAKTDETVVQESEELPKEE